MYRVEVTQKDGTAIGEIINFSTIEFNHRLNNYGVCTIKFTSFEPELESLISLRNYEVKIYRNDTLVWAGEQAYLTSEIGKKTKEEITLTCYTYLEQFNNRFTDSIDTYSTVDAGTIAWTLIDDSQNLTDGDFGITQGNIETTQDRDRTYYNQNIMEAIINLSNVIGGFDFEITNEKVFNVYAKKGINRSGTVVFEYGVNMDNLNLRLDFSKPANQGIALGEGFEASQLRETYTDTSSRSVNKLRQAIVSDPQVSETATLQEKAEELVRKQKQSLINITFKQVQNTNPLFGTLSLGDYVKIIVNRGIFNINNTFRIYEMKVNLDSKGKEMVEYLVSLFA